MIRFVNSLTGSIMWVADERKEEYLQAGHKLAAEPCAKPAEVSDEVIPAKTATVKKTVRKSKKK